MRINQSAISLNITRWGFPKGENRDSPPLVQAKALLSRSIQTKEAVPAVSAGTAVTILKRNFMRIGHGFDVHCLQEGRKLILGGVEIPHSKGLVGHSDADLLIHALCDALLGAAGLGDIGQYYPSSKKELAGIDSRVLLRQILEMLTNQGYRIVNTDITLIAQEPKLAPYLEQMRLHLAEDLHVRREQVNIKATTTDGLGYTGRKEGIAAHAVVLIQEGELGTPPSIL